jgi:hypothetical protein
LVGSLTGAVREGSLGEAKAADVIPSLVVTTLWPSACTGNVQKTAKPVKKARRMLFLVDIT